MTTKALVLLIASLVLGTGALAVLVFCALQGKTVTPELTALCWLLVGNMGTVLGIYTDRKQLA